MKLEPGRLTDSKKRVQALVNYSFFISLQSENNPPGHLEDILQKTYAPHGVT